MAMTPLSQLVIDTVIPACTRDDDKLYFVYLTKIPLHPMKLDEEGKRF